MDGEAELFKVVCLCTAACWSSQSRESFQGWKLLDFHSSITVLTTMSWKRFLTCWVDWHKRKYCLLWFIIFINCVVGGFKDHYSNITGWHLLWSNIGIRISIPHWEAWKRIKWEAWHIPSVSYRLTRAVSSFIKDFHPAMNALIPCDCLHF